MRSIPLLIVDVTVEDAKDGNPERDVINSFEHEIYYNISEWASLTGAAEAKAETPVINARDAIDAVVEDTPVAASAAEEY